MAPVHEYLRLHSRLYYDWHAKPNISKVHFSTLLVSVIVVALIIANIFVTPSLYASTNQKIWNSQGDFDSGTKSNIDTTSGHVTLSSTTTNFSEDFTLLLIKMPLPTRPGTLQRTKLPCLATQPMVLLLI
jgi:hypothetical protein